MVLLQRKLCFSKDPEGVQHFPGGGGGVQLLPGGGGGGGGGVRGVQMLISIEPHITCDFPGGGGFQTPYPLSGSAHMNRGAVKTDRNRSLIMRTDKHAYAEF